VQPPLTSELQADKQMLGTKNTNKTTAPTTATTKAKTKTKTKTKQIRAIVMLKNHWLVGKELFVLLSTIRNGINVSERRYTELDIPWFVLLIEDLGDKKKGSWEFKKEGWGLE